MALLTTWNPFKPLTRFDPMWDFENAFRGFGLRPMLRESEQAPDIRLDVKENDKHFRVMAEIPGVNKEDIEVSVEGKLVTISAEVKREVEKKDEQEVYSERYYGRAFRSFTLASDVDASKVEAQYSNGVLTLTLPKKANGEGRKIKIS